MNKSVLHWSYRNYQKIPEDLLEYDEYLEEVYLKENFISFIPDWLLQLTNLKFIHLAGNSISKIPEEIYFLENLQFFDVSDNKLTTIPPSIGELKNLTRLNISGNRLITIPKAIGKLQKLEAVDFSANLLHYIPTEISRCSNLREIILNDNIYLQSIPEKVSNISKNLDTLCADRCGLLYIPCLLSPTITYIRIFNNSFLSHIPISYEKFIASYYDVYHTTMQRQRISHSNFLIKEEDTNTVLILPSGTRKVYHATENKVSSLLELSLQIACNSNEKGIYKNSLRYLPQTLKAFVKNGPLGMCSQIECSKLIYTEYYLLIVKRLKSTSKLLFSCNFCSSICAKRWCVNNKLKYYTVNWKVLN